MSEQTHEPGAPDAMVLEVDTHNDIDSSLGSSFTSDTSSVRSSIYEAVEENGRTYHKYKQGNYYLPNDQREQSRLDIQHQLFLMTLDGKLSLAPVEKPQMVLDFGTGTGNWAIEYALQHPEAQVIGSDLSPIQPDFIPPNCRFEVDDAQDEWTYAPPFTYIHGRALFSCFTSPLSVFKSAFASLEPGGWFEMQEIYFRSLGIDSTIEGTALQAWNKKLVEGAKMLGGKDWWCTPNYASWFAEAGFVDVVEKQFSWPSNTWPKGEKEKAIGRVTLQNSLSGLSGVSMAVFTRAYGMSAEEVEAELVDVRRDMCDRGVHAYYPIYVVYGRKPLVEKEGV